jgi:hypothetical protein
MLRQLSLRLHSHQPPATGAACAPAAEPQHGGGAASAGKPWMQQAGHSTGSIPATHRIGLAGALLPSWYRTVPPKTPAPVFGRCWR